MKGFLNPALLGFIALLGALPLAAQNSHCIETSSSLFGPESFEPTLVPVCASNELVMARLLEDSKKGPKVSSGALLLLRLLDYDGGAVLIAVECQPRGSIDRNSIISQSATPPAKKIRSVFLGSPEERFEYLVSTETFRFEMSPDPKNDKPRWKERAVRMALRARNSTRNT